MDKDLRNGIWNVIYMYICLPIINKGGKLKGTSYYPFVHDFYSDFLKAEADTIPKYSEQAAGEIKKYIMSCEWHNVYSFIEFAIEEPSDVFDKYDFTLEINFIMERELSGWRVIDDKVAPITNEDEISSLEEVLSKRNTKYSLASDHLEAALKMLSEKTNPDYRNSIKESISAVECVAKIISGRQSDTLNGAIDKIKGSLTLHRSFEKGVKEMYNYTSDSGGIRHAMKDDITPDFDDAKYMLVTCSAFSNYLIAKAEKAGLV